MIHALFSTQVSFFFILQEIVAALDQCNIIPITDNFAWPEPETLPEDMRNVCKFNGVRWIHDYQDACVEKVERFMRGELNGIRDGASSGLSMIRSVGGGPSTIKSDASAPNTPLTMGRSPPTYQRTQSNESERDLSGSKDWLAANTSRYEGAAGGFPRTGRSYSCLSACHRPPCCRLRRHRG